MTTQDLRKALVQKRRQDSLLLRGPENYSLESGISFDQALAISLEKFNENHKERIKTAIFYAPVKIPMVMTMSQKSHGFSRIIWGKYYDDVFRTLDLSGYQSSDEGDDLDDAVLDRTARLCLEPEKTISESMTGLKTDLEQLNFKPEEKDVILKSLNQEKLYNLAFFPKLKMSTRHQDLEILGMRLAYRDLISWDKSSDFATLILEPRSLEIRKTLEKKLQLIEERIQNLMPLNADFIASVKEKIDCIGKFKNSISFFAALDCLTAYKDFLAEYEQRFEPDHNILELGIENLPLFSIQNDIQTGTMVALSHYLLVNNTLDFATKKSSNLRYNEAQNVWTMRWVEKQIEIDPVSFEAREIPVVKLHDILPTEYADILRNLVEVNWVDCLISRVLIASGMAEPEKPASRSDDSKTFDERIEAQKEALREKAKEKRVAEEALKKKNPAAEEQGQE